MNKTEKLVIKAKEGDKAAFEELYSEFSDKVYFFALRNVSNEDAARDITSETFMQALEGIKALHSEMAFESWLFSIAYKRCIDHLRVINRDEHFEDSSELEKVVEASGLDDPVMLPDDYAENADTAAKLKAVIDGMPSDLRSAVLLYYYEDMPISEVAKAMGISENNAKQKLFKARKKLRKKLEKIIGSGAVFAAVPLKNVIHTAFAESGTRLAVSGGAKVAGIGLTAKLAALGTAAAVAVGVPIAVHKGGGGYRPEDENAQQVIAEEISDIESTDEMNIGMFADYEYYHDLPELKNAADSVFIGTVTKRFTAYINDRTGRIEGEEKRTAEDIYFLYTVYEVTVSDSLKGEFKTGDTVRIKSFGDGEKVDPPQFIDLENEKPYLFFINHLGDVPAWPVNPEQGVYYQSGDEYLPVVKSNVETIKITEDDLKRLFPEYGAEGSSLIKMAAAPSELELHSDQKPVYSWRKADSLVEKGTREYKRSGRSYIDAKKYAERIINGQTDLNSLEAKSYIYHQMLNSIDYFSNAEGSFTFMLGSSSLPADIQFQTDMKKGTSYERLCQQGYPASEFFVENSIRYSVHGKFQLIEKDFIAEPLEFEISDNDRVVLLDDGENLTLNRNDLTNLAFSSNNCLFPQQYATCDLSDFENWSVTGISQVLDRTCITLKGKNDDKKYSYTYTIDLNTGIMVEYEEFDNSGTLTGYIRVNELSVDKGVDVKAFDVTQYEWSDSSTKNILV